MKKLGALIYGVFLVTAVRHAYRLIRRGAMHPVVLYQQVQVCLIIDMYYESILVKDASVLCEYCDEMQYVTDYLSVHYKYMFNISHGIVRVRYRSLVIGSISIYLLQNYKIDTLNTLPFSQETTQRMASDVRKILKHRVKVDV